MNAVWLVVFAILAVWGLIAMVVTVADLVVRRQYEDSLATRDWQEKVEAMRRMADREGNA